jgi:hypothetical protein
MPLGKGLNMPNTFVYPKVLSPSERSLLERRERICDEIFKESTHLEWIKDSDEKANTRFSIVKKGLVDTLLARFSEQELVSLSDKLFGDLVTGTLIHTMRFGPQRQGDEVMHSKNQPNVHKT